LTSICAPNEGAHQREATATDLEKNTLVLPAKVLGVRRYWVRAARSSACSMR
jgi:hypothetical protein